MFFPKMMAVVIMFSSCSLVAGELTKGATVIEVAANPSSEKTFAILISGGTGVCAGNPSRWVVFPESKAPSPASYNQAFSIALMALNTDKTVRIHNFDDDSCTGAGFISVSK